MSGRPDVRTVRSVASALRIIRRKKLEPSTIRRKTSEKQEIRRKKS